MVSIIDIILSQESLNDASKTLCIRVSFNYVASFYFLIYNLCWGPWDSISYYPKIIQTEQDWDLIFWSDNFYSMFVPSLPFSYQRPLTPSLQCVAAPSHAQRMGDWINNFLLYTLLLLFLQWKPSISGDKPKKIISLREMSGGSPRANKVKIQSPKMKDWLACDITQH